MFVSEVTPNTIQGLTRIFVIIMKGACKWRGEIKTKEGRKEHPQRFLPEHNIETDASSSIAVKRFTITFFFAN
jgi:hypothetical protein